MVIGLVVWSLVAFGGASGAFAAAKQNTGGETRALFLRAMHGHREEKGRFLQFGESLLYAKQSAGVLVNQMPGDGKY